MDIKTVLVSKNRPEHFALIDALQESGVLFGAVLQTDNGEDLKTGAFARYEKDRFEAVHKFFGVKFSHVSNIKTMAVTGAEINSPKVVSFINGLAPTHMIFFDAEPFSDENLKTLTCEKWKVHRGYIDIFKGNECNFWACYLLKPAFVCHTLHVYNDNSDGGDIIHQTGAILRKEDTVQDMECRSLRSFVNEIPDIAQVMKSGNLRLKPQEPGGIYFKKEDMREEHINALYDYFHNGAAALALEGRADKTPPPFYRQSP